jgi:hypothetical protein
MGSERDINVKKLNLLILSGIFVSGQVRRIDMDLVVKCCYIGHYQPGA